MQRAVIFYFFCLADKTLRSSEGDSHFRSDCHLWALLTCWPILATRQLIVPTQNRQILDVDRFGLCSLAEG